MSQELRLAAWLVAGSAFYWQGSVVCRCAETLHTRPDEKYAFQSFSEIRFTYMCILESVLSRSQGENPGQ